MSRATGPTDCCTYACNQGRNCPARCALNTTDGGQQIDTCSELDSVYRWVDSLIVGARFLAFGVSAACVVMLFICLFQLFY